MLPESAFDFTLSHHHRHHRGLLDMNLWLDDRRPAPPGWLAVRTANEARALICTGRVREISLDFDLSAADASGETGFDVLRWIKQEERWPVNGITCHSGQLQEREQMSKYVRDHGPYQNGPD